MVSKLSRLGLAKLQKTIINEMLSEMGIFQSEFGVPITRHETNYLRANLELAEMGALGSIRLGGWLRAISSDVERSFSMVPEIRHLNMSISTSDQMIQGKFQGRKTRQDIIDEMVAAVKLAKEKGALSIGVNAEDASRTDLSF